MSEANRNETTPNESYPKDASGVGQGIIQVQNSPGGAQGSPWGIRTSPWLSQATSASSWGSPAQNPWSNTPHQSPSYPLATQASSWGSRAHDPSTNAFSTTPQHSGDYQTTRSSNWVSQSQSPWGNGLAPTPRQSPGWNSIPRYSNAPAIIPVPLPPSELNPWATPGSTMASGPILSQRANYPPTSMDLADDHSLEPLMVATNPFDRPTRKHRKQKAEAVEEAVANPQPTVHFQQTPVFIPPPLTPATTVPTEIDPADIPLPASDTSSEISTTSSATSTTSSASSVKVFPIDIRPIVNQATAPTFDLPLGFVPSGPNLPMVVSNGPTALPVTPFKGSPATSVSTLPIPVTTPSKKMHIFEQLTEALSDSLSELRILEDGLEKFYGYAIFLRIPSLYFSRVARIFEDARTSKPDIHRMARARSSQWKQPNEILAWADYDPTPLPNSLLHLRASWESFIDSLMREWKTLNVVSVLLMSAILTLLQIESAAHPITRTTAFFSLICALFSLLYGCMYIIRFGTMRKMHKAASLAQAVEGNGESVNIWWNVWIMLAMPLTWLAWSIITFLASIMSFIWLTGSSQDSIPTLSLRGALGVRLALTCVMAFGIIYFVLIVREFQRYGDAMDRAWMKSVMEDLALARNWVSTANAAPPQQRAWENTRPPNPYYDPITPPLERSPPMTPAPPPPPLGMDDSETDDLVPPVVPGGIRLPPYFKEVLQSDLPLTALPDAFLKPVSDLQDESYRGLNFRHSIMHLDRGVRAVEDWMSEDDGGFLRLDTDDRVRFVQDITSAWTSRIRLQTDAPEYVETPLSPPDPQVVQEFVDLWNTRYFRPRKLEVVLQPSIYRLATAVPTDLQYVVDIQSIGGSGEPLPWGWWLEDGGLGGEGRRRQTAVSKRKKKRKL
ncbi:hypothetical protein MIND_00310900 [Mycena indigotica]|uniref:Uncharacterized protein n=1 Tax=Mycena indigotica TaxID=2126181 RepID=A0A8H6T358_9AGAR|nr:uncharacterized protein MIND_00310900 [Mycena indigotica]KAF7309401.1 hypothetical protein MIND_00310900 [Mycena indigotica]